MRIAHLILDGAPAYERKSQRVDQAMLSESHSVSVHENQIPPALDADVAHVYGPEILPTSPFARFPIPYISAGAPRQRRFSFRRPVPPAYRVSPLPTDDRELLPEAVENVYQSASGTSDERARKVIGTYGPQRPGVKAIVEQTLARIHRFRDDIDWMMFDGVPTASEICDLDVWVDPTPSTSDFDGFVAEAIACQRPTIGSRTPINVQRLEKGRTGWLVPLGDPNELTHAILAALFKPEVAEQKLSAARQTAGKFRPRQRFRVLMHMYETLIR